jgi:GntR family transcriptional regulator
MSDDTWVSESTPYIQPRTSGTHDAWTEEAGRHGHRGGQKTLEVATIDAPAEVRDALQLAAGEQVVVRRRLILLDEQPVEVSDSYYPASIAQGTRLADPRKIPGGAVSLLAELGYVAAETVETVSASVAPVAAAALLHLQPGSAVLRLQRVNVTGEGRRFEAAIMTMPSERHLTYRKQAPR